MPYKVIKKGKKYQLVNADTGRVLGTHDSQAKARAQQSAVYASQAASGKK